LTKQERWKDVDFNPVISMFKNDLTHGVGMNYIGILYFVLERRGKTEKNSCFTKSFPGKEKAGWTKRKGNQYRSPAQVWAVV
jgi:hypothetical protein